MKYLFTIPIVAAISVALSGCGEVPAQAVSEQSGQLEAPNKATSILNAGVMTEMSRKQGASVKFLFDPLYDDHFGSLQQLTPELIAAIVSGAAPYDGVDAVFVSHAHGDHFSARELTRLLTAQPQVQLIAPEQAIEQMREDASWQLAFESRITAITLENGEAAQSFEVAGALVEAFRSPHSGWPERHANTHNITYRASVRSTESGAVSRVMHLGDAAVAAEHYTALAEFLAVKRSGLAMVPFWFYQEDNLNAIIDETLNAETAVAVHVPENVPAYIADGKQAYFSSVGEVLEIPATPE